MRFMIMVRANRDTEAGRPAPESLFAEMAAYHEALAKAGVLLDGAGLQPRPKVGASAMPATSRRSSMARSPRRKS
jgi:hypothetical protein